MRVGSGGRGALDFHTWYKYSRERLKSAIFRCFLLFFGIFFRCPPLPWKRLNSAIFRIFCYFSVIFSVAPLPGNFSADALAYSDHLFML